MMSTSLDLALRQQQAVYWRNHVLRTHDIAAVTPAAIHDAAARLQRFAPYIAQVFPQTQAANGLIESPLQDIAAMQKALQQVTGRLLIKRDSDLPISGSIKARGGIYEVLKHAETLALQSGKLSLNDDYSVLAQNHWREFFNGYRIAVGSTGNLGLSIGIMSAQLGFEVTVHMSADARQWKKDLLRQHSVIVVEYDDDYEAAVASGRSLAAQDPLCHFVDDEQSTDLFFGYAVAAERLQQQLQDLNVRVDAEHPLYVYLPCGVGGGPGGVAYGLKHLYGEHVKPVFVEPTAAPCMLLSIATEQHEAISVADIGLDGKTAADGLAVGRASGLVSRLMSDRLHALSTVADDDLYRYEALLWQQEQCFIEPSAAAGFAAYQMQMAQTDTPATATHIVWATGGSMVPEAERVDYLAYGMSLLKQD
ncbi:D-serine ammonia-lyase [Vitreoscilla stercoraria]|nr:D-serine ammonia-lyase [Vitreoscilla stercoraria]